MCDAGAHHTSGYKGFEGLTMRAVVALLLTVAIALGPAALAQESASASMARVMQLWCTQEGDWSGDIDVTAPDGKITRSKLTTRHMCTQGMAHHITSERFGVGLSTVKVTYIDGAAGIFRTEYFAGGKQASYEFSFVSIESKDDSHWKTIIASKPGTELYEGRPAVLRYIRVRDGDVIESWKDVQFADGTQDFEPRSKIVQKRLP